MSDDKTITFEFHDLSMDNFRHVMNAVGKTCEVDGATYILLGYTADSDLGDVVSGVFTLSQPKRTGLNFVDSDRKYLSIPIYGSFILSELVSRTAATRKIQEPRKPETPPRRDARPRS